MGERARDAVPVERFMGQVSNADPHDVEPGQAVKQVNMTGHRPGEMNSRPGLTPVTFESED